MQVQGISRTVDTPFKKGGALMKYILRIIFLIILTLVVFTIKAK